LIKIDAKKCDGDGMCISICPVGAVLIDENSNKAIIDPDVCMECYACMNICLYSAIYEENIVYY